MSSSPNRKYFVCKITEAKLVLRISGVVNGDLDVMTFPEPLDVVFMGQEYHDFVIPRFNVDVAKMNAQVFAALKPGGLYVILDHQAAPGAGTSVVGTLHRIEASALRAQVEAASVGYGWTPPSTTNA